MGQSLVFRLAAVFRERPGVWLDGRELAQTAGAYAWRTRISDLRRAPFTMTIENRQRHIRVEGHAVTISEYRYVPARAHHEQDRLPFADVAASRAS